MRNLVSARVGEHGPRPAHELVDAAMPGKHRAPDAGEDGRCWRAGSAIRSPRASAATAPSPSLRSHRHEQRRDHLAVQRAEHRRPRPEPVAHASSRNARREIVLIGKKWYYPVGAEDTSSSISKKEIVPADGAAQRNRRQRGEAATVPFPERNVCRISEVGMARVVSSGACPPRRGSPARRPSSVRSGRRDRHCGRSCRRGPMLAVPET